MLHVPCSYMYISVLMLTAHRLLYVNYFQWFYAISGFYVCRKCAAKDEKMSHEILGGDSGILKSEPAAAMSFSESG